MFDRLFTGLAKRRAENRAETARLNYFVRQLESLPDWVSEPDEDEWNLVSTDGSIKGGYDESQLKDLRARARKFYYTGGGRGLIDAMNLLILGKNASVECEDEKSQKYWEAWAEANEWDRRSDELVTRVFRDGEVFLRFYAPTMRKGFNAENPTQNTVGAVRFVNPDEITDKSQIHSYGIETAPGDVETVVRYHRCYWQGSVDHTEQIPAAEIVHMKILCDSDEKRGVSWLIGVAKWIKKYELWLDDRSYLNRLRTIFNLIIKPEGITPANFASNFEDEEVTPSSGMASKKLPKRGSLIVSQGVDYEFKRPDVDARDTATDGRHMERMICKITQLVEGVVTGDYSNQNYASSLVAEAPMVKMIERWQDRFEWTFQSVFQTVIRSGKRAGHLSSGASEKCSANFATVIHRELDKDTNAYQVHKSNGWASDRTISTKLGYDYDAEQEQIDAEDERDRERNAAAGGFGDGGDGDVDNGRYPVITAPGKGGKAP